MLRFLHLITLILRGFGPGTGQNTTLTSNMTALPAGTDSIDNAGTRARLRILSTTDLHMNLLSYDYFLDRPAPHLGLAGTASLIRSLRALATNSLLVDNGDFLQGNPLSDELARRFRAGERPGITLIEAMNALGYDAGTLGNHEFNYGIEFLEHALAQARFPVVSANVARDRGTSGQAAPDLCPPFVVLDRTLQADDGTTWPFRIGVIGFAPPQIMQWDKYLVEGQIRVTDMVEAARLQVPALRAAGAEIVVALCHTGPGPAELSDRMENAAVPLAAVPGIDALVLGHTHQVFPGPSVPASALLNPDRGLIHGKPAVMAGANGSHLGVIDLILERGPDGWTCRDHKVRVEPIARRGKTGKIRALVRPDPVLTDLAQADHDRMLSRIRRPVGRTAVPLHSYFTLIGHDSGLRVVADAQRAWAERALAQTPFAGWPLVSAVAPFKAGGRAGPQGYLDVPAGPLLYRHASELYLYPNGFCVLALDGAAISEWLERSAALFLTITAGQQDQPLIDTGFPAYNFDVLDGLSYVIDPSQPPRTDAEGRIINPLARRVSDIRLNGRALDPAEPVLVATNSYRAGGGGGFSAALGGRIVYQTAVPTSDIVLSYIESAGQVNPADRAGWRFAGLPGTTAWFDSGPGSVAHAAAIPALGLPVERPDGFFRYTLSF